MRSKYKMHEKRTRFNATTPMTAVMTIDDKYNTDEQKEKLPAERVVRVFTEAVSSFEISKVTSPRNSSLPYVSLSQTLSLMHLSLLTSLLFCLSKRWQACKYRKGFQGMDNLKMLMLMGFFFKTHKYKHE